MDINYYKQYEPLFGSWKIVRLIGEGSYGKVFEVERQDIKKTYKAALKAITIPANDSELRSVMLEGMSEHTAKEYFRSVVEEVINEFDLMAQMKGNSNIVSYEDHMIIEHRDGVGWDILIRMELLTPLNKHYKENGMSKADVIKLGIDMCRALEVCQRNGVIHRDIKPENIFISPNGDYKLGDFGVAKSIENSNSSFSKKGTGVYMAPEVYKGRKYDRLVDIYSVGLVMYRYLNNNILPFLPQNADAITYKKKEEALERRMSGEPLPSPVIVDDALFSVIRRACAYYPQDRYSNPSDMRRELERILAREESIDDYSAADDADESGVYDSENGELQNEYVQPEVPVNKSKKTKIIIAVIAAIILVAGAVFGAIRYKSKVNGTNSSAEPAATASSAESQSGSAASSNTEPSTQAETTSELTTLPNISFEEYIPSVGYSKGQASWSEYSNQWADIRIPIKTGYINNTAFYSSGANQDCIFSMKSSSESLAVLVDKSGAVSQKDIALYMEEEVRLRTLEMQNEGYTVKTAKELNVVHVAGFTYNHFVLELKNRRGTVSYSSYYCRKVGDYMVVINTITNDAATAESLIASIKTY